MDENLQPTHERRVDQDLRCAIDLLRMDVVRARVVLTQTTRDQRGPSLASALTKSFDGLIQAVRQSWSQRDLSRVPLTD